MGQINEALLRKQCRAQHGEILGDLLFDQRLAAITRAIAIESEMAAERAALCAQIAAQEAAQPGLEPLRIALDRARERADAAWVALENQRIRNQSALASLHARISEIDKKRADSGYPARIEGWTKLPTEDTPYFEPLIAASERARANSHRAN